MHYNRQMGRALDDLKLSEVLKTSTTWAGSLNTMENRNLMCGTVMSAINIVELIQPSFHHLWLKRMGFGHLKQRCADP